MRPYLPKPDVVLFHGNCDDGFGAAWSIHHRWPDGIEYIPGVYGVDPDISALVGKHVAMVDFSYKKPVLEAIGRAMDSHATANRKGGSVTIIDHHKTAQEDLAEFTDPTLFAVGWSTHDEFASVMHHNRQLPIRAHFDMTKSGAILTWEAIFGDDLPPEALEFIQDRDLWKFELPDTKQFSAALRTHPQVFEVWDMLMFSAGSLIEEGRIVLHAHEFNVGKFVISANLMQIDGVTVPGVNVPYHYASDTAHALLHALPECKFAAAWFLNGNGKIQFSLRSEDSRADVSEVAKKFGGGGHRNAAGFEIAPDIRFFHMLGVPQ